jgi:hypothetical protein
MMPNQKININSRMNRSFKREKYLTIYECLYCMSIFKMNALFIREQACFS